MTARGCTEKQERASPSDAEGGARIFAEEKREMGHLLCFYLLELGMAAAWCRWVICREVDLPALLRTARTVWSGERQVLGELLLVRRRWTEGEETERFRQAWRRIALRLLPPLLYLTLGGALAPVLAWSMFPEGAGQLAMGCCVLAGLAGGCFKAGTQRTVEELSWMQGELEGLRSRPGFLKEHTRPVEWDQKKRGLLVLLLLAAAAVFGTVWGLSHSLAAAGPMGESAALVLLALLWLLSEQPWRKKKEERSSRAGRDHPREQPGAVSGGAGGLLPGDEDPGPAGNGDPGGDGQRQRPPLPRPGARAAGDRGTAEAG